MFWKKSAKKSNKSKNYHLKTVVWQKVDTAQKENDLKIKENALSDSVNLDLTEETITEGEIANQASIVINKNHEVGLSFFKELDSKTENLRGKIDAAKNEFDTIHKKALAAYDNIKAKYKIEFGRLKGLADSSRKNLNQFKVNHQLSIPAETASRNSIIFTIFLVVILAAIEMFANWKIIKDVMIGGSHEGMIISITVAVINVGLTSAVGFFIAKHVHNVNQNKRSAAILFLSLYIPGVMFYMNWCMGAVRTYGESVLRQYSTGTLTDSSVIFEVLVKALKPWTVEGWSLPGVLLVLIGFSFAVFSLAKAYYLDDTYPGYGKHTRRKNKSEKDIENEIYKLKEHCRKMIKDFREESLLKKEEMFDLVEEFSKTIDNIEANVELYNSDMKENKKRIKHIHDEYKKHCINQLKAHEKEVPKRFAKDIEFFEADDLNAVKKFAGTLAFYMKDGPRIEMADDKRKSVTSSYEDVGAKLTLLEKEIIKNNEASEKLYA